MSWITTIGMIAAVAQTFLMAFGALRNVREFSRHRLVLDFGQRRITVAGVLGALLIGAPCVFMGYEAFQDRLSTDAGYSALALSMCYLFILVIGAAESITRVGVYDHGLRVPVQFLFFRTAWFASWDSIQQHQWQESGHGEVYRRLIINPGHRQAICLIPKDFFAEVHSLLKEKCHADAEVLAPESIAQQG